MTSATDRLIDFYCGTGTDHRGRTFATILRLDDAQLERTHDYIQWLFPTVTASRFSPDAPCLDAATVARLRADSVAQTRLREAMLRMLAFYGLQLDDSDAADLEVAPAPEFDVRSRTWLTTGNHNYRRLTRILETLCILGHRPRAQALFHCLYHLYRTRFGAAIGVETLNRWRQQVE